MISLFDRVENTVGKGENAGYQHFLLFPQVFSKAFFFRVIKSRDCVVKCKFVEIIDHSLYRWTMIERTLRITNIQASDAGAYTCIAENDEGFARAVGHLRVECKLLFFGGQS